MITYVLFLKSVIFLVAGTLPSLSAIGWGQVLHITDFALTPGFIWFGLSDCCKANIQSVSIGGLTDKMRTFVVFSFIFAFGQAAVVEDETLKNILTELNNLKTIVAEQQLKIQSLEKKLESVTKQNRKIELDLYTDPEVLNKKINQPQTKVPDTSKKVIGVNSFHS